MVIEVARILQMDFIMGIEDEWVTSAAWPGRGGHAGIQFQPSKTALMEN